MNRTLMVIILVALVIAILAGVFVVMQFLPSGGQGLGDIFGVPSGASPPPLPE